MTTQDLGQVAAVIVSQAAPTPGPYIWARPTAISPTETSYDFFRWNGIEWVEIKGADGQNGLIGEFKGEWLLADVPYFLSDVVYHAPSGSSYLNLLLSNSAEPDPNDEFGAVTGWHMVAKGGSGSGGGGFPPDNVTIELNGFDELQIKDKGVSFAKIQDLPANAFFINPTNVPATGQAVVLGENQIFTRATGQDVAATNFSTTHFEIAAATFGLKDKGVGLAKIEDIGANTVLVNNTSSPNSPIAFALGANEFLGRGATGNIVGVAVFDAIAGVGTLSAGTFTFIDASITSASIVIVSPSNVGTLTSPVRYDLSVAGQVTFTAGGSDTATFNFFILNP